MGKRGRTQERLRGERKQAQESDAAYAERRHAEFKRQLKRNAENARRRAARAAKRGEG
jgi:hypothetical protein